MAQKEEGDLIIAPPCGTSSTGHIGILANENGVLKVCEAAKDAGRVRFREIDEFVRDPSYKEVYLFHVGVEGSKKKAAASYASSKLGQKYYLFSSPCDRDTGEWYCSKLVYMAYLSTGITLNTYTPIGLIWPTSLADPNVNPFAQRYPTYFLRGFGYDDGWRVGEHPRFLVDTKGRNLPDIVGFGKDGVYIAFNNGDGAFGDPKKVLSDFAYPFGGWHFDKHPRFLADMTKDGRPDIVGFGDDHVFIAFNNGDGTFKDKKMVLKGFGYNDGWRVDRHPRFLADMTGDGYRDIVGFKDDGVYIAFNKGDGTFEVPKLVLNDFGYTVGGWCVDKHPRFLADMTGDGRPDIVGFGYDNVIIAFNKGNGTFETPKIVLNYFGYNQGWHVDKHPRFLADMKGDGCLDIVGFGNDHVFIAFNGGDGYFTEPKIVYDNFTYNKGWFVDKHPRFLADITGDGRLDILGFKSDGVYMAFNNGDGSFHNPWQNTFQSPRKVSEEFGYDSGGWRVDQHLRLLADTKGRNLMDIVGFGCQGVFVQYSNPKWERLK